MGDAYVQGLRRFQGLGAIWLPFTMIRNKGKRSCRSRYVFVYACVIFHLHIYIYTRNCRGMYGIEGSHSEQEALLTPSPKNIK